MAGTTGSVDGGEVREKNGELTLKLNTPSFTMICVWPEIEGEERKAREGQPCFSSRDDLGL